MYMRKFLTPRSYSLSSHECTSVGRTEEIIIIIIIIIIMQRLTRHVSVIRLTNRRRNFLRCFKPDTVLNHRVMLTDCSTILERKQHKLRGP